MRQSGVEREMISNKTQRCCDLFYGTVLKDVRKQGWRR
jgi:hypothetical protein